MSSDEYGTPQVLFERIVAKCGPFTVDAAANAGNTKCARWFGEGGEQPDGLEASWEGERVWCNPPYSRGQLPKWIAKAAGEKAESWLLVPADTSTAAFRVAAEKATAIVFLTGRVQFDGGEAGARFGSALLRFTPERRQFQGVGGKAPFMGPTITWWDWKKG